METRSEPDSRSEPSEVQLAFVFADVCRSTELLIRLGDRRAHQVMSAHREGVRAALALHRGREVELRGDGFLAVFDDDSNALRAALELRGLPHRIGIHSGIALSDEGKFFGRNVVLAARLCENARAGEILVSDTLQRSVGPFGQFAFGPARLCALRGFNEPQQVYPASRTSLIARANSDRIGANGASVRRLAFGAGVSAGG